MSSASGSLASVRTDPLEDLVQLELSLDDNPKYSDPDVARLTRKKRVALTPEMIISATVDGSRIPSWKKILKEINIANENKLRKRTSHLQIKLENEATSIVSAPSSKTSSIHGTSGEMGSSGQQLKRSEDITSELDVTRRGDLDKDTLEHWWVYQATAAHRRIAIFLVFLAAIIFTHFVFGILMLASSEEYPNPYLCSSDVCKVAAARIKSKMDESVDPCEDFHQFVCGKEWEASKQQKSEEKDAWALITRQIQYDFTSSRIVGEMLRNEFNVPLLAGGSIRKLHQSCMDIRKRNGKKLEPVLDLFVRLQLHSTNFGVGSEPDLPNILKHAVEHQLIKRDLFDLDVDFENKVFDVHPVRYTIHSVHRFGFDTYRSVVKKSLQYLSENGKKHPKYDTDWGDDAKLEIYSRLFTCAGLNLLPYPEFSSADEGESNRYVDFDVEGSILRNCKFERPSQKVMSYGNVEVDTYSWRDFMQDPTILDPINPDATVKRFDYKRLIHLLYGSYFEDAGDENVWKVKISQPPNLRFHLLDGIFSNAELIIRYQQWRFIRWFGPLFDETLDEIMWPITRDDYQNDWITTCIKVMFDVSASRASTLYLKSIDFRDSRRSDDLEKMAEELNVIIKQMNQRITFPEFVKEATEQELKGNLNEIAFSTIDLHWHKSAEVKEMELIRKVASLRIQGDPFGDQFFQNILTLKAISASNRAGNAVGFSSDVSWRSHAITQADISQIGKRCAQKENISRALMPLGTLEPPYYGHYFPALDIGGAGFYSFNILVQHANYDGMFWAIATTIQDPTLKDRINFCNYNYDTHEAKQPQIDYGNAIDKFVLEFPNATHPDLWVFPGEEIYHPTERNVNNIYKNQLSLQLSLKLAYELHEYLIARNETHGKLFLPTLEKYNARQLFFIQAAHLRCEKYSKNMFKHKAVFGPIPTPISINLLAGNSKDFSKVFKCKPGSRMNPNNKVNFYK